MKQLLKELEFYKKIKAKLKNEYPDTYTLSGIDIYINSLEKQINKETLEAL